MLETKEIHLNYIVLSEWVSLHFSGLGFLIAEVFIIAWLLFSLADTVES